MSNSDVLCIQPVGLNLGQLYFCYAQPAVVRRPFSSWRRNKNGHDMLVVRTVRRDWSPCYALLAYATFACGGAAVQASLDEGRRP